MPSSDIQLPKWLERRYAFLWESFRDSSFGFEDAVKVLGEKNQDRREDVLAFLSELRKAGWLEAEFAPEDARGRVYRLKSRAEKKIGECLSEIGLKVGAGTDLGSYLDGIKNRIIQALNPVKIILFGSYAWGIPTKESDLDLLVIMESKESQIARAVRVSRLLGDIRLPMDIIVLTPQEVQKRLEIGDFFYKEILERGRVLYERIG